MNLNPQPLFNKTVIEKLCSKIELTDLQKQSALDWIKMIENAQVDKEQENQNEFEDYVLHNILGYEIRECKREKFNIDYTIDLPGFTKSLCIEVKGTKTKDLFKDQKRKDDSKFNPVIQLYTYMGHGYDYGVVTNYNNFILLTQNTQLVKAHKFDFLSIKKTEDRIDENKLKEFILLFSKKEVFVNNSIEELSNQTVLSEQEFTDEFYKLFHETRLMLIKEFEESSDIPHDVAIHYSQIFLNRLIFIYFVEDHNFIPSSLFEKRILSILQSPSIDETTHLIYDDILGLFKIMNTGSKIQGINGFNGGLFGDDAIPSNITFSDLRDTTFFTECYKNSNLQLKTTTVDIAISGIYAEKLSPLIKNLLIMASHDFTSDLNVNILGHIFEQSISDIELLKENETSKRKKDGVYYTPDYITDYICRHTIISYLSKTEKNSVLDLVDEYSENLEELETKLKNLKILDPACGSGAFLVKAVDILLEIDEEIQLRKPKKIFSQMEMDEFTKIKDINLIIENNIYGVDLNPASVEITKLSLFLKLAGPQSKLGHLSNNIKVGNSLIDDISIDEKAFSWKDEFPEIMGNLIEDGGFHIIVGNPPYLRIQGLHKDHDHITKWIEKNYQSSTGRYDYYVLFLEKATLLLKNDGMLGYIIPHKFTGAQYGKGIRKFLFERNFTKSFINFGSNFIFKDASVYTGIIFLENKKHEFLNFIKFETTTSIENKLVDLKSSDFIKIPQIECNESSWLFHSGETTKILNKITNSGPNIMDFFDMILQGTISGDDEVYYLDLIKDKGNTIVFYSEKTKKEIEIEKAMVKPLLLAENVKRNKIPQQPNEYVVYPYFEKEGKQIPIDEEDLQLKFPLTYNYLAEFKTELITLRKKYKTNVKYWHGLHRPRQLKWFEQEKIITPEITFGCNMTIDKNNYVHNTQIYSFLKNKENNTDLRYFLAILNSKILWFFIKQRGNVLRGGYLRFNTQYFELFHIPTPTINSEKEIIEKFETLQEIHKIFDHSHLKFINRLNTQLGIQEPIQKIRLFYKLSFKEFLDLLKKNYKINLTIAQENDWEDYFESLKKCFIEWNSQISKIDFEINKIVYNLYEFTNDEILIIEKEYPS